MTPNNGAAGKVKNFRIFIRKNKIKKVNKLIKISI